MTVFEWSLHLEPRLLSFPCGVYLPDMFRGTAVLLNLLCPSANFDRRDSYLRCLLVQIFTSFLSYAEQGSDNKGGSVAYSPLEKQSIHLCFCLISLCGWREVSDLAALGSQFRCIPKLLVSFGNCMEDRPLF